MRVVRVVLVVFSVYVYVLFLYCIHLVVMWIRAGFFVWGKVGLSKKVSCCVGRVLRLVVVYTLKASTIADTMSSTVFPPTYFFFCILPPFFNVQRW